MKAYLIGNGASIPYGSPPGCDIFKRAFELFYQYQESDHNNQYYRLKQYIFSILNTMDNLHGELVSGRLNSLHMGKFTQKFNIVSNPEEESYKIQKVYKEIEAELSAYEIWRLFPEIIEYYNDDKNHGYGNCQRKRLVLLDGSGNFFDKIAEFSFKTIYFAIKEHKFKPNYYHNFVKILDSSEKNIVIINLNYDNLLEKALEDSYSGLVKHKFGGCIQYFPMSKFGVNNRRKIILFKPHGSFDFLFCNNCGNITISKNIPLEFFQDMTNQRNCKNPRCKKRNLQNFFIPYTDVTLPIKYKSILKAIIREINKELESIDEITTIGYSFSEYKGELIDKHLKFIFEDRKVIVVAKDLSENEEICKRIRKYNISAENSGFNGFADYVYHKS